MNIALVQANSNSASETTEFFNKLKDNGGIENKKQMDVNPQNPKSQHQL